MKEKIIGYLDATKTEVNKFKSAAIYNQKGIQCNGTSMIKETVEIYLSSSEPKYRRNRKVYELVLREVKK